MDIPSPLQKRVYELTDKIIGTEDVNLNAAVKTSLLQQEMTPETVEQIQLKLAYNNWLLEQVAKNEMQLTFDAAGNVITVPTHFEEIGTDNIDVSGADFESIVYEPTTSKGSA